MTLALNQQQFRLLKYWLPALVSGAIAWLLFLLPGGTPLSRASGLALSIVAVTLTLRRMGSVLAGLGGLTLALSPAFWAQTGGAEGDPATIVVAIAAAGITAGLVIFVSKRPWIAFGLGIVIFSALFWSQIGTPRSLRLTGFVVSWLLFVLVDMLLLTNPHPDEAPPILRYKNKDNRPVPAYYLPAILLLFATGVINDPLLVLMAPAMLLAFFLMNIPLPRWYMPLFLLLIALGLRGLVVDYFQAQPWLIDLSRWRDARYWINMIDLVVAQFTPVGIVLGVLGLARLSRWYPPLGSFTLVAYGTYIIFGLVYTAGNRDTLLLPLFIIQITWMTYALFAIQQWIKKSLMQPYQRLSWLVPAIYGLLPLLLLYQISSS